MSLDVTQRDIPPDDYEQSHVHSVYEEIAQHFSETRYKPWPIIAEYLKTRPTGSIGADIGCGNGKNLNINPHIFIVGSDRSKSLAKIAGTRLGRDDAIVADILNLPHQSETFDFAICIAVVHHLSSHERRVEAIKSVLSLLKPFGTALFYVWALEQKNSRRGWDENSNQDVMVPWVRKPDKKSDVEEKAFQRYYHLYRKDELENSIREAAGEVVDSGYEKDNWWAVARNVSKDVIK